MKLVDFGCRSSALSSNGGQTTIRGDASLSLLLFEADAYDIVTKENGKKEKIYRGGSRGAFEKMSVLREGAVVALLNPRILKPFQVCLGFFNFSNCTDTFVAIRRCTTSNGQRPRHYTGVYFFYCCDRLLSGLRHVQSDQARWLYVRQLVRQASC